MGGQKFLPCSITDFSLLKSVCSRRNRNKCQRLLECRYIELEAGAARNRHGTRKNGKLRQPQQEALKLSEQKYGPDATGKFLGLHIDGTAFKAKEPLPMFWRTRPPAGASADAALANAAIIVKTHRQKDLGILRSVGRRNSAVEATFLASLRNAKRAPARTGLCLAD